MSKTSGQAHLGSASAEARDFTEDSRYPSGTRAWWGAGLACAVVELYLFFSGGAQCNQSFNFGTATSMATLGLLVYSPAWAAFIGAVTWTVWREGRLLERSRSTSRAIAFASIALLIAAVLGGLFSPCPNIGAP
jgi:hypothetical protein